MKRFSWLFLLLVMIGAHPTPAHGQAAILVLLFGEKVASENFYFSLKLGANVANLSGVDDSKAAVGLNFGMLATIKLSEKWYLVPEFSPLSKKGANNIPYLPSGNEGLDELIAPPDEATMDLNYIDIPVIAKYQVAEKFQLGTGPQFGFLTGSSNKYERELDGDDEVTYAQRSQTEWNTFDYGWAFEATYNLWDARDGKGLFVHARYTLGLADIIKDNPGDAVRNSAFQFFVSFPFIESGGEEDGS